MPKTKVNAGFHIQEQVKLPRTIKVDWKEGETLIQAVTRVLPKLTMKKGFEATIAIRMNDTVNLTPVVKETED